MKKILFPAATLFVGCALGYFLKPAAVEAPAEPERDAAVPAVAVKKPGDNTNRVLRARIRELESQLAAAVGGEGKTNTAEAIATENNPPRREDWRERMERFRRDNPEGFARMEKRRQEFMQRRAERAKSKLEFLGSLDTAGMTEKQKSNLRRLQELVARRDELESSATQEAIMNSTEEERREFFAEMREINREMHAANEQARDALLDQTAKALGYEGDDAKEVVSVIKEIYEHTDNSHGFGGFGRTRNRGGRR